MDRTPAPVRHERPRGDARPGHSALVVMGGYAICAEPRSGSSFLGGVLASTGVLGRPLEYFNTPVMRKIAGLADYPDAPDDQLRLVQDAGATENGVYAVKVFGEHFERMKAVRWVERLPSLSFVYLERRDRLGQAISFVRAMQTQQWTAWESAWSEPVYDRALIDMALRRLAWAEARWRYYFARNGLAVLNLVYEEVAAGPQAAAEAVGALVGLADAPIVDIRRLASLTIQRDALNEEWRARFIAESRDLLTFDDAILGQSPTG